ncbi:MAG: ABC transporter substrate-binding protein, partial [Actinomycetota bacterium]
MHRRQFLQAGSAVAAALATGTLAACGSDDEEATGDTAAPEPDDTTADTTAETTADTEAAEETTPETTEAAPAAGGTVRVGLLPSPADVLNPANTAGWMEYSMLFSITDSLVLLKGDQFELQLAESIEPNADATEYTIVLREGPTFHDGTPVTSADVIYSLGLYAASPNFGQFFALIDFANISAPDDRTVIVPMVTPRADLVASVLSQLSMIVPEGFTDWGNNIGSGPFILEQFEQGVGGSVVRNPDYWGGAPSIERVEFIGIAEGSTR